MAASYGQVRDVLNTVVEFHRRLREFYSQLAEQTNQERVRILLDYMSRHERGFEQALAEYDQERTQKLLDMWMQYTPEERVLELPKPEKLRHDMTVDEVVNAALRLDDELVRFYSQAARLAQTEEIRDLFTRLVEQQEDEEQKLKLNALFIEWM
jgi:rubrerythrin